MSPCSSSVSNFQTLDPCARALATGPRESQCWASSSHVVWFYIARHSFQFPPLRPLQGPGVREYWGNIEKFVCVAMLIKFGDKVAIIGTIQKCASLETRSVLRRWKCRPYDFHRTHSESSTHKKKERDGMMQLTWLHRIFFRDLVSSISWDYILIILGVLFLFLVLVLVLFFVLFCFALLFVG